MSSNKRLCLRSDTQNRDSFDERVCNDLCEVILQFLPLKAKLKLECVSKQFQRSIILTQKVLQMNFETNYQLDQFARLFQKFARINDIDILDNTRRRPNGKRLIEEVLEVVIKYCDKLINFEFAADVMDTEITSKFMQNFGLSLVSLNVTYFPRISAFWGNESNVENLIVENISPELNGIQFNRLKSLEVLFLLIQDVEPLEVFLNRNKSIKHLSIECKQLSDETEMKRLMDIISKLTNLVHLDIASYFALNDKTFAKQLTQISVNCNQLKSLRIYFSIEANIVENFDHFLSALKQFKQLKRLDLCFAEESHYLSPDMTVINNETEEKIQFFSFKLFKGFECLTHLRIRFNRINIPKFEETVLTDIDTNLPNLQSLVLKEMELKVSEWTAHILIRLSRLQTIKLYITEDSMISLIKDKLISNLKKVREIDLSGFCIW